MKALTTEDTEGTEGMASERDPVTEKVIGCAIEVHRALGPGLLESAYEHCMARELTLNCIAFRMQVPVSVHYKGIELDFGYRIDLLIGDQVLVELKSVERLTPVHDAQVLTYMKLAQIATGLLINFNTTRLVEGVRRFKA